MTRRPLRLGLLAALTLLSFPALASAATPWTALSPSALAARGTAAKVETAPAHFKAFALDRDALTQSLGDDVISIPDPTGTLVRFRATADPVLAPALAAQHPEIRTFAAVGIDDPSQTARFDLTPLGFHASVRGDDGAWYVDPYYKDSQSAYVAYAADQLSDVHGPFSEGDVKAAAAGVAPPAARAGEAVTQRTYRLALINDPTYAAYFGTANVLAAKTILVNRTNQLYNDDLGIKLVLIDQTPKLNLDTVAKYHQLGAFGGACGPVSYCYPPGPDPTAVDPTNPTGPTPNIGDACGTTTIATNSTVLNALLTNGAADYDIGHLALGRPGGGVAGLGVVGNDTSKARGCTGVPTPTGDYYAVDYFSHEVGHQFGANHTFGGTQYNCAGSNRNDATAVEPGSGSSVMGYAGICRQDNLQPHSDPYFSQRSIDEIQAYVATGTNANYVDGYVQTPTANHAPVVSAPAEVAIPPRTPFTLSGSATDQDAGAQLVYLWEENDTTTGGVPLVSNDKPAGALFRVFGRYAGVTEDAKLQSPSPGENVASAADATRTFPDPAQIAADDTNAKSGKCPDVALVADDQPAPEPVAVDTIECYSEFLPTTARTLHFRLTARDRTPDGGGVGHADTTVTVAGTNPFRVTTDQATATPGATVPVTWDVADTAAAPVNATQVKISYSTDGGLTFPTVLAEATPNDGMEPLTIPDTQTTTGRFKVEAVGNPFFDVSHTNLTVAPAAPAAAATPDPGAGGPASSPTPAPTTTPNRAGVRPDLRLTARRPRVSRKRRVQVLVRCRVSAGVEVPARCRGSVTLFAKLGGGGLRRIAGKGYAVAPGSTRVVTLTISRRAYGQLRRKHRLTVQIRATANGAKTHRTVKLRR